MKTYNKSLHTSDYAEQGMGYWLYLYDYIVWSNTVPYMPNPHIHRRWEYAMAMEFLKDLREDVGGKDTMTVLDVGGAGSIFGPLAMHVGFKLTVVDPDPCVHMLAGQIRATNAGMGGISICEDFMQWQGDQYDAVVSLSTIEHVEEDVPFLQKLASHAKLGLFLTTDFSMDGGIYSVAHLRTYTPKTMKNKLAEALPKEWKYAGDPEWIDNGPFVAGYNFASLGMAKE